MQRVPRAGYTILAIWALAVGFLLTGRLGTAEARPEYKKGFDTKYKEHYDKAETKTACEVCHVKGDKKNRVEYGEAFGKVLGATKVKDMKKIEESLGKVEEEKSPVEGKKFIDLIKEGKYPSGNDPS
jgi:hypothetical protein